MSQPDPRQLSEFLLSTLDAEMGLTVAVFEAVPPNRLDYRPDPLSRTALGLLRHITLEDEWILNAVTDGRFGPLPDDSDACGIMTPGDAVSRYRQRVPAAMSRVRALSSGQLTREFDLMGKMKMPAIGFLSLMVRHSVHHRGQLSAYLRAMGGKVPPIYGPSADTTASA